MEKDYLGIYPFPPRNGKMNIAPCSFILGFWKSGTMVYYYEWKRYRPNVSQLGYKATNRTIVLQFMDALICDAFFC